MLENRIPFKHFSILITILLVFSIAFTITRLLADKKPPDTSFDLKSTSIPASRIKNGGPGKDGIPAIDQPHFIASDKADFLKPDDRVLGLDFQGIQKAYPIRILNWHEIVNDRFDKLAVVITYCPLCGSGVAYNALIADKVYHFGVSGLLYNSDVLLYDRETQSLWSQLMHQAIAGPMQGTRLQSIAITHTSWQNWKNRYPKTLVLSTNTGFIRNYEHDPYQNYQINRKLWFPVDQSSSQFHPKAWILGIEMDGKTKAYPFSELDKMPPTFNDSLSGKQLIVKFDTKHQTAAVFDHTMQPIPTVTTFWFAWYAFHPETEIFEAKNNDKQIVRKSN